MCGPRATIWGTTDRREGTKPFYYDKSLPIEKALHPDTILAWAQNGQLLEHLHGTPVRLLVPDWSGNWSVKWLTKLEVMEQEPGYWYHYQFYYYGTSPNDPDKELITTIGVKSIVTQPNDDTETMPPGIHMIRGYAWSAAGAIDQFEIGVDGGKTWHFPPTSKSRAGGSCGCAAHTAGMRAAMTPTP